LLTRIKPVTINSMHDYSYSFVREEITSKPDFDKEYDIMAEPWCTIKTALCGNFLPVIVTDVPEPDFDIIDSIPGSGTAGSLVINRLVNGTSSVIGNGLN